MKKFNIFVMAALACCLTFTSCDDDDNINKDIAGPQTSPQEKEQTISGFVVSFAEDLDQAIVLDSSTVGELTVEVASIITTPELTDRQSTKLGRLQLATNEDFTDYIELDATYADGILSISGETLDATVKSLYGKAPYARDIYFRTYIYVVEGTSASMIPTPATYGPVKVTPIGAIIEEAYYLIGTPNGWSKDVTTLLAFSHSGRDVYQDSKFTLTFDSPVNADGEYEECWYKIVPKSLYDRWADGATDEDGILGVEVNGDTSLEGILLIDGQAAKIEAEGKKTRIVLNMMESTYQVSFMDVDPYVWVPGDHQGDWNPSTAPQLFCANDDLKYVGYLYLDGGFKILGQPDWNNDDMIFGGGQTEGLLYSPGGNITASAGFYQLTADLGGLTYEMIATEWGIIGDGANGWGDDDDIMMTYDVTERAWIAEDVTLIDGSIKFRANHGWDINFGGTSDNLNFNDSNNLPVTAGTYTIKLYLSYEGAHYCTIE